jgi:hypothetical protein
MIVHDDDFVRWTVLFDQAAQAVGEAVFFVPGGNDDRDVRLGVEAHRFVRWRFKISAAFVVALLR